MPQGKDIVLLISLANYPSKSKLFLLNSNLIEKIILENKLLIVNLTEEDSHNLLLYQPAKQQ